MTKFLNILKQAIKPGRLGVMLDKVRKRMGDTNGQLTKDANLTWLRTNSISLTSFAESLNGGLWREGIDVCQRIKAESQQILSRFNVSLGGGGCYPLLYFVTRLSRPNVVVETGVAAGFSSYAFLAALEKNQHGSLYSSDFPYFRLAGPEQYIGIIVPEELRKRWSLFIEGDKNNLPKILGEIEKVDLFHYDSDKSYAGRDYALDLVCPRLRTNGIIIMDDIQDNSHFHDYVTTNANTPWKVFEFEGKYVGMIGKLSH